MATARHEVLDPSRRVNAVINLRSKAHLDTTIWRGDCAVFDGRPLEWRYKAQQFQYDNLRGASTSALFYEKSACEAVTGWLRDYLGASSAVIV